MSDVDEEKKYECQIVPHIVKEWLQLNPNLSRFESEIISCLSEGVESMNNFERWSLHDDMNKYKMVLEEWDDMVGDF